MSFRDYIISRVSGDGTPQFNSDKEREQYNKANSRARSLGGTSSYYGPKGDGPGSYVQTGFRYATTQSPGGRGFNRKEIPAYTWQSDSPEQQQPEGPQSIDPQQLMEMVRNMTKNRQEDTQASPEAFQQLLNAQMQQG